MRKILFTTLVCLTAFLSACSSKQSPIDDLSELAEELSANGDNYTEEEWESAAEQFEGITEDLEDHSYSDEEYRKIGKLKARVYHLFSSKYGAKKMKQALNEFSGAMEEIGDNPDTFDDMEDLLED